MKISMLAALGAALFVGGATAALAGPTPSGKVQSNLDPDQVVCHYVTPTGSRLGGSKVCQTRAEWAKVAAESRRATDDADLRTGHTAMPGH
jgi:hypothetical protein